MRLELKAKWLSNYWILTTRSLTQEPEVIKQKGVRTLAETTASHVKIKLENDSDESEKDYAPSKDRTNNDIMDERVSSREEPPLQKLQKLLFGGTLRGNGT